MNQRPRTIEEQVSLLRAKGMEFEDLGEAKELLARISYFRLKYFWTDLIDDSTDGDFLLDTSFDMVMKRYNFDHNHQRYRRTPKKSALLKVLYRMLTFYQM